MARRSASDQSRDPTPAPRGSAAVGVPQAGVVAIRGGRVCLITSSSGRRWVVPKGKGRAAGKAKRRRKAKGERGERERSGGGEFRDLRATARREAWEEAGLVGRIGTRPLGRYEFEKAGCRHVVVVYRMWVTAAESDWPERGKRLRDWVRPDEVAARISHPGLRDLLRAALTPKRAA